MNDTRTTWVVPDLSMVQSLPSRSSVVAGPLPCVDSACQSRELPQMRCMVRVSERCAACSVLLASWCQQQAARESMHLQKSFPQIACKCDRLQNNGSWKFAWNEPPTVSNAAAWAREANNVDGERDILPLFMALQGFNLFSCLSGQSIDQIMTRREDCKKGD